MDPQVITDQGNLTLYSLVFLWTLGLLLPDEMQKVFIQKSGMFFFFQCLYYVAVQINNANNYVCVLVSNYTLTVQVLNSALKLKHIQQNNHCSRDSHIWGIGRGQHSRSAMAEPRAG